MDAQQGGKRGRDMAKGGLKKANPTTYLANIENVPSSVFCFLRKEGEREKGFGSRFTIGGGERLETKNQKRKKGGKGHRPLVNQYGTRNINHSKKSESSTYENPPTGKTKKSRRSA